MRKETDEYILRCPIFYRPSSKKTGVSKRRADHYLNIRDFNNGSC